MTPVLILDNGAYSIKAGFSGIDFDPRIFPNSIARSKIDKKVYVSDEIDQCRDLSGIAYRRPFDRGMLVHWDAEKIIWDRIFSSSALNVDPPETSLLLTEPYFNLPNIAETYDQIVFEEYEFASYFRTTPAALIPYGGLFGNDQEAPPECMILIDIGYSYSHVIPMRDGQIIWEHVKRIDVGGKLMTNHLKHLISFRQWNMLDQTCVVNSVREACGYVTLDWKGDIELCKRNPRSNPIVQEYVLPDFSPNSNSRTGYIRSGPGAEPPGPSTSINGNAGANGNKSHKETVNEEEEEEEQVLYMGNERFSGSELLFNPQDIGLKQSGLPETVALVISQMPEEVRGMYWAHIGIFGGLGNIPGLGERLERDLRTLCPIEYELGIFEDFDPQSPPYHSALSLTASEIYLPTYPVTRAEYLEHGSGICRRRFGGPAYNINPPFVSEASGGAAGTGNGSSGGGGGGRDLSDDERERRYAMGMESKYFTGRKGKKGTKGKKRKDQEEEEEVVTGSWGGRRRRGLDGL